MATFADELVVDFVFDTQYDHADYCNDCVASKRVKLLILISLKFSRFIGF